MDGEHKKMRVAMLIPLAWLFLAASIAKPIGNQPTAGDIQLNQATPEPSKPFEAPTDLRLYFATKDNQYLRVENRVIRNSTDPAAVARNIIYALVDGPRTSLMRTLPPQTQLRSIFVTEDGTAYVDFADALKENHPGGVQTELLTIYSIVNSLALNITGIDIVKILIQGRESPTLNGHIDLQKPFTPEMLLIR